MPDHDLKVAIAAAAGGVATPPFSVIRRRDARNRRRRSFSLGLVATGALAVVVLTIASQSGQPVTGGRVAAVPSAAASSAVPASSGTQAAASVSGVPLLLKGLDPRSGQPFTTAAKASAAGGGFYVPDCPGDTDYYLQLDGSVVTFFQGNDTQLSVSPPQGPFVSGPIHGNSLVTPQTLIVQGQQGYGYETTPRTVQISPTHVEGVLVHSYLTWSNRGSSLQLWSVADLSLSQLQDIANSCT